MSSLGNKGIMSENLNRLMQAKGISRNKLCDDLDLKYSTVTDWIKGKVYPRIDKIELLADYFNVQKSDLVEKYNPEKEKGNDIAKMIDNNEYMSFQGRELSDEDKEILKRIFTKD